MLDVWVTGGYGTWAEQMEASMAANMWVQVDETRGTSSQQVNTIAHA